MKSKIVIIGVLAGLAASTFFACGNNQGFFMGTPTSTEIVVYFSSVVDDGDLGGRTGADAQCIEDKPANLPQANVRAFLSVTATDEIRDMPQNYGVPTGLPVIGTNDVVIADDWDDLLDGSIDNPLEDADLPQAFYTGSTSDGSGAVEDTGNCTEFTAATGNSRSTLNDITTQGWLGGAVILDGCADTNFRIMCLAF